ncbi:hypothetical protein V6R21_14820 [Limibacter armeniacum]|uniref:hypothetical protein n=1 Tax=Limibacter armeniacum TaxID=466084 RepID=UPI002FE64D46
MRNNNKVRIYPVIEMSPWQIDGGEDIEIREGQDFSEFAIEIFKKNGIENIEQLDPYGYCSIKVSDISDNDLKIFIDKEVSDAEIPENGIEAVGPFSGGLVIVVNDQVVHHQCCGDISDYKNWKTFLEESPEDWSQIWIGHPWLYGRVRKNNVELSDYIEHTGRLEKDLPVHLHVDKAEFELQFNLAIEELLAFKKRIYMVLKSEMKGVAKEVSELLIEGDGDPNNPV